VKDLTRLVLIPMVALLLWVPAAAQDEDLGFSAAELDQMLAPIALYPDVLLSQILIAATYPLEVVEAERWSRRNPGLDGEDAVNAVSDRDWDPSVKALVAFPRLLERMSEDLDWTTRLGEAYLYQEADVVDAIQALRDRAYATGHLESTDEVRVYREREVIYIEPVHPRVVYVPYYHPAVVYGPWWWSAYPPVYWGAPRYHYTRVWFHWGAPVRVAPSFYYSAFDWHRRHIVVLNYHLHLHQHRHVHVHRPSGFQRSIAQHVHEQPRWEHDPHRRRGVGYRHPHLQQRYGRHDHPRSAVAGTHGSRPERSTSQGFTRSIEQRVRDAHPAQSAGGRMRAGESPGASRVRQQQYARPDHARSALAGTHGSRPDRSTAPGFTRSIEQRVRDGHPAHGAEARMQQAGERRAATAEAQRASSGPTGGPPPTADRPQRSGRPSAPAAAPASGGFTGTAARRTPINAVHPEPSATPVQRREMARPHPVQTPSPVTAAPPVARAPAHAPAMVPGPARSGHPGRGGGDRGHEAREQAAPHAAVAEPAGRAGTAPRGGFQGAMGSRMERER
jgi:hypothetical protein